MAFAITRADIPALALGSSVLACGGGGNPYYGQLIARQLMADGDAVRVIDVDEMAPEGLAIFTALMGAPLVGIEKPPSLRALRAGFDAVERSLFRRRSARSFTAARSYFWPTSLCMSARSDLPTSESSIPSIETFSTV